MGKTVEPAARFIRSWEDRSGARFAELEYSTGGGRQIARAWRVGHTVEVDLNSNEMTGSVGGSRFSVDDLLDSLRSAPLCAGTRMLRLRLPAHWIGQAQGGRIRPATLRLAFVCDSPPRIDPPRHDLESIPVADVGRRDFMALFGAIMAPQDLGFGSQVDINRLAASLWNREAVDGIEGYEGFAVVNEGRPIAVLFTLADESGGRLGFAGLVPEIRRTTLVAAVVQCAVDVLNQLGAFPLSMEIDIANQRSLRIAERRCGPATSLVAVYDWLL